MAVSAAAACVASLALGALSLDGGNSATLSLAGGRLPEQRAEVEKIRRAPTSPFGAIDPNAFAGQAKFFARLPEALPSGVATATSFWDPLVVRNQHMTKKTLASPYWPLGTKVRITYRKRTVVGVVRDFGPAPWAVAQHPIPAIIDTAEPMMAKLTGQRVNAVPVHFEVLSWGRGRFWLAGGPGYSLAMGKGVIRP